MGLLDGTTQNQYYQGDDYGNYQFTSLEDIINYFMVAYVGEDKIIPKITKLDVGFHAQRALQELSFDTFKSIKSQQIEVPATLQMILPHDYVNYTRLSWVDESGIKHPLYSTKHTSNPFEIKQEDNGNYFFGEESNVIKDSEFDNTLGNDWNFTAGATNSAWDSTRQSSGVDSDGNPVPIKYYTNYLSDTVTTSSGQLEFGILWNNGYGVAGGSKCYAVWQRVDVALANEIELTAVATSGARQLDGATILCDYGTVRVGITSTDPDVGWFNADKNKTIPATFSNPYHSTNPSPNMDVDNFDLGYLEWDDGSTSQKELLEIDVSTHNEVWVYVQSFSPWTASAITTLTSGVANGGTTPIAPESATNITRQINMVDSISVVAPGQNVNLENANSDKNSTTWNNYKSTTPSENNNDNYEDDTYWPYDGKRYGLEPSHAQVNGSFFIDQRLGKIHFSSNISGKTVILDYISDSLGTNDEMQVHKFAEDAMYKWIAHAILSTSSYGQALVPRLTKEKFAAVRKAKLRLSNIKLEELTQILRGKSKQIKH